jgi:AraC-like DNA-binding protein
MVKVASALEEKDARISEVAFQFGFSDMKHFRECFKKEFGQTPSAYIKVNR